MSLSGMTEPKDIQYPKYHHCGFQHEDHWFTEIDEVVRLCPIPANQPLIDAYNAWMEWSLVERTWRDVPEVLWDIENAEQWGR